MSLTPGARIGVYEIVAFIGAGGMGEVYRARDTRLKRDVAIKILPEAFANDRDRVVRFQRTGSVFSWSSLRASRTHCRRNSSSCSTSTRS